MNQIPPRRAGGFRRWPQRAPASTVCRASNGCLNLYARAAVKDIVGVWRRAMRRVISLYLPRWPSDLLRKSASSAPPRDKPLVIAAMEGQRRVLASIDV